MSPAPRCIFIVDDEEAVRLSLRLLLQAEGLAVQTFESARAALTAFDRAPPACILTDYHMPDLNGSDLVREVRSRNAGIPLVVMTGNDDPGWFPLGERIYLIHKPFDAEALVRMLRALADGRSP